MRSTSDTWTRDEVVEQLMAIGKPKRGGMKKGGKNTTKRIRQKETKRNSKCHSPLFISPRACPSPEVRFGSSLSNAFRAFDRNCYILVLITTATTTNDNDTNTNTTNDTTTTTTTTTTPNNTNNSNMNVSSKRLPRLRQELRRLHRARGRCPRDERGQPQARAGAAPGEGLELWYDMLYSALR